mmetsp:Transcript_107804/g.196224  ORF Transcript_107804/g.196224 Transcript_107804/m.196224 type:complete len:103 (+) Transcript_107804:869-1177(+)
MRTNATRDRASVGFRIGSRMPRGLEPAGELNAESNAASARKGLAASEASNCLWLGADCLLGYLSIEVCTCRPKPMQAQQDKKRIALCIVSAIAESEMSEWTI